MAAAALIFDLDGTVWDSHAWFAEALSAGDAAARSAVLADLQRGRSAATALKRGGFTRSRFRTLCEGPSKVGLYPGAPATLSELSERTAPLGVVTNLPGWMANPMLGCTGLGKTFGSVVTYERTTRRKPHPAPLLLACEELGLRPAADVWYVGDSVTDCRAATAAGLSFAWASWGYSSDEPDECDARLETFEDVLEL